LLFKITFKSAVKKLSGIEPFAGDKVFLSASVFIRVSKLNESKWGTSSGVMDDLFNNSSDISFPLGIVEVSELSRGQPVHFVRFKNTFLFTLSLVLKGINMAVRGNRYFL